MENTTDTQGAANPTNPDPAPTEILAKRGVGSDGFCCDWRGDVFAAIGDIKHGLAIDLADVADRYWCVYGFQSWVSRRRVGNLDLDRIHFFTR